MKSTVVAVVATAGLAVAAAGCGGSPAGHVAQLGSTTTPRSSTSTSAVAFSECMRAHGVPRFPDPNSGGAIPKLDVHDLGVGAAQFQRAQSACQHLFPTNDVEDSVTECISTGACPGTLLTEIMTEGLAYANCMRRHGVTNFPDPTRAPDGAPVFKLGGLTGTDWRSPQIEAKMNACWYVYSPGVRVGLERPGP